MKSRLVKMITNQILAYYNHLLAISLLYLTVVDPIRDIANTFVGHHTLAHHNRLINLVLASSASSPGGEQDYYKTLGVKKDATKPEIHKAFRQLAKKYHPDKNKDKSATDEFIKIFKAYETLSDEQKRKEYDAYTNDQTRTTTAPNNAYDFDINDFFRQYEDQFLKHSQQHHQAHQDQHHHHQQNYHHQQHQDVHNHMHNHMHNQHFKFHGINLDELFRDVDEDEFSTFKGWFDSSNHDHDHFNQETLGSHFGDGASFFGHHFLSESHDTLHHHQQHHQQNHYHNYGGLNHHAYSCHTTTKYVNGIEMTQTSCA